MNEILPWQRPQWESLVDRHADQRLPAALLLSGPRGIGKRQFARVLLQGLLCNTPTTSLSTCGVCRACHLLQAGTHPDALEISPLEEGKPITVDQIRAIGEFIAYKPQFGAHKVVIISPAEAMNVNAANSLLKSLEEPTPGAVLILECARPQHLLATVRSRCQTLLFPAPSREAGLDWLRAQAGLDTQRADRLLQLAHYAPLTALQLHEEGRLEQWRQVMDRFLTVGDGRSEVLDAAAEWRELGLPTVIPWIIQLLQAMIRLKSGVRTTDTSYDKRAVQLQDRLDSIDTVALFGYLDRLTEGLRLCQGQINQQLLGEELLIAWTRLHRPAQRNREVGKR